MFDLPLHVASLTAAQLPAADRHIFSADAARYAEAHASIRAATLDGMLLVTCHRIELAWWGEGDGRSWLAEWLAHHGLGAHGHAISVHHADLAVRHMVRVVAGLESPSIGEREISQQWRRAWQRAKQHGVVSPSFDGMLGMLAHVADRIRHAVGDAHTASIGDVVVGCIQQQAGRWPTAPLRVLLVGSGHAAQRTALALHTAMRTGSLAATVAVTGRTTANVRRVAEPLGWSTLPWDHLVAAVADADVVVLAIAAGSTVPIAQSGLTERGTDVPNARTARPAALWIDLGVVPTVAVERISPAVQYVGLAALHASAPHRPRNTDAEHRVVQRELQRLAATLHRRRIRTQLTTLQHEAHAIAQREAATMTGAPLPPRGHPTVGRECGSACIRSSVAGATLGHLVGGRTRELTRTNVVSLWNFAATAVGRVHVSCSSARDLPRAPRLVSSAVRGVGATR